MAVLAKLVLEEPVRPSELRPGVPSAVEALLARLMAKESVCISIDIEIIFLDNKQIL